MCMIKWFEKNTKWATLPLRLTLGILFLVGGIMKIFVMGIPNVAGFFESLGIPIALFFAWVVGIVELVGGLMLILGLFTRQSALLLSVIMLVALLTAHLNGTFATALVPLGGTLALLFTGSGPLGLDNHCGKLCEKKK